MRAVTYVAIASLLAPSLVPAAAAAQPRDAGEAIEACAVGIRAEVREQFPQAMGVRLLTSDTQSQGYGEVSVIGKGEFDDRNGGQARFKYGCVYNFRSGRAYALDVTDVRPASSGKDNSAAIAGLVLGAIIVGALVASKDKDHDRDRDHDHRDRNDAWSPAPGVRCDARQAACYEDGRYSRRWTQRVFVR